MIFIHIHNFVYVYTNANVFKQCPPNFTSFLSMASSSVNKENRMLTPVLSVPQTHRTIFFERKFGSSISFAASPGNGSLASRVCMRWAHLPLSRSYSKFLVPGQLVTNHRALGWQPSQLLPLQSLEHIPRHLPSYLPKVWSVLLHSWTPPPMCQPTQKKCSL